MLFNILLLYWKIKLYEQPIPSYNHLIYSQKYEKLKHIIGSQSYQIFTGILIFSWIITLIGLIYNNYDYIMFYLSCISEISFGILNIFRLRDNNITIQNENNDQSESLIDKNDNIILRPLIDRQLLTNHIYGFTKAGINTIIKSNTSHWFHCTSCLNQIHNDWDLHVIEIHAENVIMCLECYNKYSKISFNCKIVFELNNVHNLTDERQLSLENIFYLYDQLNDRLDILLSDHEYYCQICGKFHTSHLSSFKIYFNITQDQFPFGFTWICPECDSKYIHNCIHCGKIYISESIQKEMIINDNICKTCFCRYYSQCTNCRKYYINNQLYQLHEYQELYELYEDHELNEQNEFIEWKYCFYCISQFYCKQIYGIINQFVLDINFTMISNIKLPSIIHGYIQSRIYYSDSIDNNFLSILIAYLEGKGIYLTFRDNQFQITLFSIDRIIEKIHQNIGLEPYELCPLLFKYKCLYWELIERIYPDHNSSQQIKKYLLNNQIAMNNSDFSIIL